MAKTIHLATIGAPFGVRGHFRLKTLTENPEDSLSYGPLTDDKGTVFDITLVRVEDTRTLIVTSTRSPDRTAAENLRGTKLYGKRKELSHEDDDTLYVQDLVGLEVKDQYGDSVGKVFGVENYGASDILVIKTDSGYLQIAFIEESVPTVDIEAGTIVVIKEHLL